MMEFLTQGEAADERALATSRQRTAWGDVQLDDNGEGYRYPSLASGRWSSVLIGGDENRALFLLLSDAVLVKGWTTRRFLNRRTYWTYDPRFARVSQFVAGFDPVVLPACVEPIGWCYADEVGA